jgi:gamma-glutamylcyclotransferase (GGCT)/AIG2-like uncharacterized protein YtfP
MHVFVYGTLKKGHSNHAVLRGADFVCHAYIRGYDMYHLGGFPGIIEGNGEVYGEVYKITDDHLPWLDRLEGYSPDSKLENCMYLRKPVSFETEAGKMEAFVYIWNGPVTNRKKIESGIWT